MKLRIAALVISLLGISLNGSAVQGNNNNCPPDPDAGSLTCRATCASQVSCRFFNQNPVGTYCWRAYSVSGGVIACHNGLYDPCCDPNYQW